MKEIESKINLAKARRRQINDADWLSTEEKQKKVKSLDREIETLQNQLKTSV